MKEKKEKSLMAFLLLFNDPKFGFNIFLSGLGVTEVSFERTDESFETSGTSKEIFSSFKPAKTSIFFIFECVQPTET